MSSPYVDGFCTDASYITSFDILNIPSVPSHDSAWLSSLLGGLTNTNISTYTSSPTSILFDNFKYEVIPSLPLAKTLLIQCPVPACIFPISGYFTFLQRILFYINMGIATFALHVPLLRGVVQIWLTTFWFSVLAMYVATIVTKKVPTIYNLDLQPAAVIVHIGLLPTILWFSFHAELGKPRRPAVGIMAQESWIRRRTRECLDFPVTRILVPIYALWGVINIVLANAVQDSAGFWPKATAVILSNATSYILTSPCFEDPSGFVGLWPPSPSNYNGIRALNSLSIYYPPPASTAIEALQAVPRTDLLVLHVGSVFLCFVIIFLSFVRLSWLENFLRKKCKGYPDRTIRYLAILPFTFPLFLATIITLYLIIVFEANVHRAGLPENEAYTEIGQWGPYFVATLVYAAVLIAKLSGWDFDSAESRGFEWLLAGDRQRWWKWELRQNTREEGLVEFRPTGRYPAGRWTD